MGYDSSDAWKKKTDVKASYVRECLAAGLTLHASASSKDGYWFVWSKGEERFIEFALIEKENGRFYLKTIPESMGPYYFDCPLKFLDMVPETKRPPGTFSFREQVRAFHGVV